MSLRATLIILNWKRPQNVRRILDEQLEIPQIADVLVWSNNPEQPYHDDRVKTINADQDLSLRTRYAAASLAETDWVVWQDDDLIVRAPAWDRLEREIAEHGDRVYGFPGRAIDSRGGYDTRTRFGDLPIALTRWMAAPASLVPNILLAEQWFRAAHGWTPQLEGEDILMALAGVATYGAPCRCLDIREHHEALSSPHSISRRTAGPERYRRRSEVIRCCREVLSLPAGWDQWVGERGRPLPNGANQ